MVHSVVARRTRSHGECILQGGYGHTSSAEFRQQRRRHTPSHAPKPQIHHGEVVGNANAHLQRGCSFHGSRHAFDLHAPSHVLTFYLFAERAFDEHQDALRRPLCPRSRAVHRCCLPRQFHPKGATHAGHTRHADLPP